MVSNISPVQKRIEIIVRSQTGQQLGTSIWTLFTQFGTGFRTVEKAFLRMGINGDEIAMAQVHTAQPHHSENQGKKFVHVA